MLSGEQTLKAELTPLGTVIPSIDILEDLKAELSTEDSLNGNLSEIDILEGFLVSSCGLNAGLTSEETMKCELTIGSTDAPYYGPYEVVPKTVEQYLDTDHKYLIDDVTVFEIPYAETTNVYGTTVTIAS